MSEHVRRLREHPLIEPPQDEIRTRAYFRWLDRGSPVGSSADDWLAAELEVIAAMADLGFVRPEDPEHPSTELFEEHYSGVARYRFRVTDPGRAVFLGGGAGLECSLCGRSAPSVTFRKEAHVIPELLGNRWLFTHDECDECNERYGRELENELGAMLLPERAVAATASKKRGAAKLSLNSDRSSLGGQASGNPLRLELKAGDPSITYQFANEHELVLGVPQPRFKPQSAARALGKMAWHLLPAHARGRHDELRQWVTGVRAYASVPLFHFFFPGPRLAVLAVALWETPDPRFPRLVAAVFAGNTFLILPCPQANPIQHVILPVVLRSPFPPHDPIARKRIALSDERTPLGRTTFTMSFASQRMLFASAASKVVVQKRDGGTWVDLIRCSLTGPPTNTLERAVYHLRDGDFAGSCELLLDTTGGTSSFEFQAALDLGGRGPSQVLATVAFLEALQSGEEWRAVEEDGQKRVAVQIPRGSPQPTGAESLRAVADLAGELRVLEEFLHAELSYPAAVDAATLLTVSIAAAVARKTPSIPLPGGTIELTALPGAPTPAELFRPGGTTSLVWPFVAVLGSLRIVVDRVVVLADGVRASPGEAENWTLTYESGVADLGNAVIAIEPSTDAPGSDL